MRDQDFLQTYSTSQHIPRLPLGRTSCSWEPASTWASPESLSTELNRSSETGQTVLLDTQTVLSMSQALT